MFSLRPTADDAPYPSTMRIEDFDYELPPDAIAQVPDGVCRHGKPSWLVEMGLI